MGQTAKTVVADISDHPIARKRTGKPLRGSGHYTGNLTAFKHLQVSLPADAARRGKLSNRSSGSQHSNLQELASNDSVIANKGNSKSTVGPRSKIATAVLIALATGAVLGSIWTASKLNDSAPTAAISTANTQTANTQTVATPQPVSASLAPSEPDASLTNAAPPGTAESQSATPLVDPIVEELNATRNLANQYLEEIDWLHTQNGLLEEEIEALNDETTSLNYDLLQLELAVAALEADAQPIVETRTVYNFVNVPIGGGVEPGYEPTATENYNQPVNYEEDYQQDYQEPYDEGAINWENEEQVVDFIDSYSEEEDMQYIEDLIAQEELEAQLLDDALIYDPETGYYIDPNYVPADDEINTLGGSTKYPPIQGN